MPCLKHSIPFRSSGGEGRVTQEREILLSSHSEGFFVLSSITNMEKYKELFSKSFPLFPLAKIIF
jgi:hypothetical protein